MLKTKNMHYIKNKTKTIHNTKKKNEWYKKQNKKTMHNINHRTKRGCPHGVMVKAMDCGIVVHKFVLQ